MTTSNTITQNDFSAIFENIHMATFAYGRGEVGEIKAYGGSTIPAGWLLCDGQAVSRTTYPELFSVIGTTYGSGDGSTTFNVPDLRGRFPIGSGTGTASDATERTLGQSGGSERVTLNIDQIPSHNHTQRAGGYTYTDSNGQGASTSGAQPSWGGAYTGNTVLTFNTGGGQSHGNMPPYMAINYIIYAKNTVTMTNPSLDLFYPVGSYYETSDSTFDPNVQWGGTWVKVEEGRFLQATETAADVGTTVSAGLPNITGYVIQRSTNYNTGNITWTGGGALAVSNISSTADGLSQVNGALAQKRIDFNASNSNSIYGNSTTVQPPAIKVYMWHRTA